MMETLVQEQLDQLAAAAVRLEHESPQAILKWAVEQYPEGLSMACSFGMQSVVMLHMLHELDLLKKVEVFYLDTGVLFPETHQTRIKISQKYDFQPVRVSPKLTMAQQAEKYGDKLWEEHPDQCCGMRKVEPMKNYLAGKKAWITGMRRGHNPNRANMPVVLYDQVNQITKFNPLALFDDDTLWGYIKANEVPYNPLYDMGYPSIGCTHCTRPVKEGEDPRSGRWAGKGKVECGIHMDGHVITSMDSAKL